MPSTLTSLPATQGKIPTGDFEPRRSSINIRLSRELAKCRVGEFRSISPLQIKGESKTPPQAAKPHTVRKTPKSSTALAPVQKTNAAVSSLEGSLKGSLEGSLYDNMSSQSDKPQGRKVNNTALILITATGSTEVIVGPPRDLKPTAENQAIIEFETELARLNAHIARLDTRLATLTADVANIKFERDH